MASSRDREAWTHIFKLYKGFPHLWDKNNIHYGNRSMMTDGYKALTRVYRAKLDKQASVSALRLKMKNLRTTYYRELRNIKDAKERGKKYSPSLWYFENLNFLGNARTNESTNDTPQNDDNEDSLQMQDLIRIDDSVHEDDLALDNSDMEYDQGPSTSQPKLIRRTEPTHDTRSPSFERQDPLDDNVPMKDEHWEVIGKSIGYQLRDLNRKQYTIVSKLISDAIYFGRLNKLSEMSRVDVGSSYLESHSQSPRYSTYTPSVPHAMGFHAEDMQADQNQTTRIKQEGNLTND